MATKKKPGTKKKPTRSISKKSELAARARGVVIETAPSSSETRNGICPICTALSEIFPKHAVTGRSTAPKAGELVLSRMEGFSLRDPSTGEERDVVPVGPMWVCQRCEALITRHHVT